MRRLLLVAMGWAMGCEGGEAVADIDECSPSWEEFGRSFTLEYCNACHAETAPDRHDAPEGVTFDTEEQALQWADRMVVRVEAGDMPPGGGMSEVELEALREWARCKPQ